MGNGQSANEGLCSLPGRSELGTWTFRRSLSMTQGWPHPRRQLKKQAPLRLPLLCENVFLAHRDSPGGGLQSQSMLLRIPI